MYDMDKVLHGLNSCGYCDGIPNVCGVTECPYESDSPWCTHYLAHDAGELIGELLKAQGPEAVDASKPDSDIGCWYDITHNYTLEQIVNALKAQEPRVMTLEEVKAMKRYTICAVEQRSKVLHTTFNAEYRGHLTIDGRDCIDFGLYADVSPFRRSESGYGKTWRCWNIEPSDEQRKNTPWKE